MLHGFIPEFLVGCVLLDQLLLLLWQLEGFLYLHPFRRRLFHRFWLCWENKLRLQKQKDLSSETKKIYIYIYSGVWLGKKNILVEFVLLNIHFPSSKLFQWSHWSHLSSSHNTLSDLLWASKSTHHYLLLSSALHYFVETPLPHWPLDARPPPPCHRSPLSP